MFVLKAIIILSFHVKTLPTTPAHSNEINFFFLKMYNELRSENKTVKKKHDFIKVTNFFF